MNQEQLESWLALEGYAGWTFRDPGKPYGVCFCPPAEQNGVCWATHDGRYLWLFSGCWSCDWPAVSDVADTVITKVMAAMARGERR